MIDEEFTERMQAALAQLDASSGPLTLFALNRITSERWDLLVSAPAFNSNASAGIRTVGQAIRKKLTRKQQDIIAKVVVIPSNEPLPRLIASAFDLKGKSDIHVQRSSFNGIQFEEMHIYRSTTPSVATKKTKQPRKPAKHKKQQKRRQQKAKSTESVS